MTSFLRLFAIMHKEILQLSRDRLSFGMIIGIPVLQLMLFGYAINTDVRGLSAAYSDQADTHLSRQVLADIRATQVVNIRQRVAEPQRLEQLMNAGDISIGIVIPEDFDRRVIERDRPALQLLVDGSDPVIIGVAQQLSAIPIGFDSQRSQATAEPLVALRNAYNPEKRSAINIVPGLIGVILTMTMVLFTAVAIVREKERGNIELLINTPVLTFELMLGKILPYVFIGILQLLIILGIGTALFDLPIRGSYVDILLVALLFIAANLSLGLLISTVASTQFQAMQMTFFFFLPSILLSGFMFPFEGMPAVAQTIAEVLPLTHFNRLIRGIILRGSDLVPMAEDLLALLLFLSVSLVLAIMRFRKRLD